MAECGVATQRERRFAGRIQAVVVNEPGALAALCSVIGQQAGNITHIQLTERDMNFLRLFWILM